MINIDRLQAWYRENDQVNMVLQDIHLEMMTSEIGAVIGPSGCGKSTLLKVLASIHRDYRGSVTIGGLPPNPKRHRIGFIPQHHGLLPWKDLLDNVILLKKIKDGNVESIKDDALDMMSTLGIDHLISRFPRQVSGGQQQRAAIARAFLMEPDLLLMDEPFSALDAITREEIQEVFLDVWKKNRITTLIVTHSAEEAVYLGRKIIILSPMPGTIIDIVDNPLFEQKNKRETHDFYDFVRQLRERIKKGWSI